MPIKSWTKGASDPDLVELLVEYFLELAQRQRLSPKESVAMAAAGVAPDKDVERDAVYFGYYAQFVHQQNMLQDTTRTSLYRQAIQAVGPSCIKDKAVMDVGAGSGNLSSFCYSMISLFGLKGRVEERLVVECLSCYDHSETLAQS